MRLEDYLINNAWNHPHDPALTDAYRTIDFDTLLGESEVLAAAIQARGIVPGDRVAVLTRNRIEFVVVAFACFLGGYIFQPINFRLSAGELRNVLEDSEPEYVFVDSVAFPELALFLFDETDYNVVAVGEGPGFDWGDGSSLPNRTAFVRPVDPSPIAALLYTGGTTGKPKGTAISHHGWVHSSRDGAYAIRLVRSDVSYMCIPLFHVSFVHYLSTHYLGIHTILAERVRPDEVVDVILNKGVTHVVLVQTSLVDLLNYLEENPVELPQLSTLQYGASPIAPAVIERVCERFGDVLYQNFGSTELAGGVTYLPPHDHSPRYVGEKWRQRVRSAGFAMPGQVIGIFDDDGNRLPAGETGEIWVKSESVMVGYWKNEAATREVMTEDGWFMTGDVGWLDEDGYLYIVDRKKDMIISGGENIYARDVEDTILAHPSIREAAVVGAPHERLGEQVVAFIVLRDGSALTADELLAWLTGRLSSYKKPAEVRFVTELPRTTVGKIHKPTLRQQFSA